MMEDEHEEKIIKSAFDSTTFDADVSIHVDRDVGSATISPSGRDVALASKDGLDIIDLDSPLNPPRHLRHPLTWSVVDVQWSPFAVRDYWVVSTANQKALVWNLSMSEDSKHGAIEHTLHGHDRAITDINFHAFNPDILSTCAVDGYVHCWDLRRPRKPCMTFCDWFAGATQVKWNRQDPHILASSHDRWLHIWDDRMGAYPLRSIEAHESKIYGVDWNRTRASGIVTCSLDRSIRFWDYRNPEETQLERVIRTDYPVWRARHTPFGWGLMAMPQTKPGDLHLYERRLRDGMEKDSAAQPVATFPSHESSVVKEFLWRSRGSVTSEGIDERDWQLVSWGADRELRLQRVDSKIMEGVGYVKGTQVRRKLNLTRSGAAYKTFRNVDRPVTDKKPTFIRAPARKPGTSALTASMRNSRMPVSAARGEDLTRPKFRGTAMKGRGTKIEIGSQIGWMSGIKFTSKSNPIIGPHRSGKRYSLTSPTIEDWDAPESLHDEIIRIHNQLPKVTFDDVNMDKRSIVVSMNGPWGEDNSSVFIKVTITFPDQYPESKTPNFILGQTSAIADDVADKIVEEMKIIAEKCLVRRQGCLEPTLGYLLGEVSLEESTAWLTNFNIPGDDELDGLADESSSDDGDSDIPAGASAMMSQELDPNGPGEMFVPVTRNVNVPLPRLCGATFSNNGKLVCFFPPKEDKIKSLLGDISTANRERSRGEHVFDSIKRLKNESPGPRHKVLSFVDDGRSEDYSSGDESYSSDSSDSDSSPFPGRGVIYPDWRRRSGRSYLKTLSTARSQRSSAAGTGTGTGTGTGVSKSKLSKPKNIIAMHDVSEYTPAKQELAECYAIFGDGPDVCDHNAQVAARYGYKDLSDIWYYCGLLLRNEVPLMVLEPGHRRQPVFVVAKEAIRHARQSNGSDSGLDLSYDMLGTVDKFTSRIKWGHNPLAKYLIDDLFDHFEAEADIQMLAMLSCIFSETLAQENVSHMELRLSQPQTPLSMKTPAFSLDYFPSDAQAWSMYQKSYTGSAVTTPKICPTPNGLFGSVGSSNGGLWGSDPASTPYSCGDTPPMRSYRGSSDHLFAQHTQSQSLSTSPENSRTFRRANSGIASSFAAFSRPFGPATASSSPPSKKRPSPVENMLHTFAPNAAVTWGNTTILGSVREHDYHERAVISDDDFPKHNNKPKPACTGISVSIENQNAFDDEGCMSAPLLESRHTPLFSTYRRSYAELLFMWQCNLSRLEILKFNGLKEEHHSFEEDLTTSNTSFPTTTKHFASSTTSNDQSSTIKTGGVSTIHLGRRHASIATKASANDTLGLDVIGYCLKHDLRLQPIQSTPDGLSSRGAIGRCERCKSVKRQLRCVVCMEPVSALFVPCLSCGCVRHPHCQLLWHGQPDRNRNRNHNHNSIPNSRSASALATAALASDSDDENEQNEDSEYDDDDEWDSDVAQTQCPGGCDCDCTERASQGVVESWEVMMGAIETMRKLHAAAAAAREDTPGRAGSMREGFLGRSGSAGREAFHEEALTDTNDWDPDLGWEDLPAGGLGRGYSTLTVRLDKVRTGEFGGALRRRASDLHGRSL